MHPSVDDGPKLEAPHSIRDRNPWLGEVWALMEWSAACPLPCGSAQRPLRARPESPSVRPANKHGTHPLVLPLTKSAPNFGEGGGGGSGKGAGAGGYDEGEITSRMRLPRMVYVVEIK